MHIFRAKKTHYSLFVSQLNKNNLHLTNLEPIIINQTSKNLSNSICMLLSFGGIYCYCQGMFFVCGRFCIE